MVLNKIFGSRNQRLLRRMQKTVKRINALEPEWILLSDEALRAKTDEFRTRLADHETVHQILPEAFATVREVAKRCLGQRHYDVQLIGGMVLHEGKISEMRTGEGKTLTETLPAYLNALSGKGVHIVTVNDYLAERDAAWMGPIYEMLGMRVGVIVQGLNHVQRQEAYGADITYGTNNEFGFDYLRDNMAVSLEEKSQRPLHFAIVDEVDSILIDEARTPLVISGAAEESSELYRVINELIPSLKPQLEENGAGDYTLDEKSKQAFLTEAGQTEVESLLISKQLLQTRESLYAANNISLLHHINAGLRAHTLFQRDVDYIVQDHSVVIIDEHTGRMMPGRRWSDGLHQAIEAKEGVEIQHENHTLASITFQNYFRLYERLSGMTGTADTEAYEFQQIYGLEVVVVPTNKQMIRNDFPDVIYLSEKDKFLAIIEDIKQTIVQQRPILVGTASIEHSELLSQLLEKKNIEHQVLNAKFHEQEAKIIAQAGCPGAVTIATNMAGRGTDIALGGNLEAELAALDSDTRQQETEQRTRAWHERHQVVVKAGGLHIIGSERHESRRIDNQLRGRAGRQGDPGSSRFYLSLEDNLIRIFATERMASIMQRFGMKEGVALESKLLTRQIEGAQRKVEARNFEIRKQLLEYDDVANEQRKVIYEQRDEILATEDLSEFVKILQQDVVGSVFMQHVPSQSLEELWKIPALEQQLAGEFNLQVPIKQWLEEEKDLFEESLLARIEAELITAYANKSQEIGAEIMRQLEKAVLLQSLDNHWKDHLAAMDYLRQGIHLRGFAQKNPKQEYKREAFELFAQMLDAFKHDVVTTLCCVEISSEQAVESMTLAHRHQLEVENLEFIHAQAGNEIVAEPDASPPLAANELPEEEKGQLVTFVREGPKIGRNDVCPCGSGKKYKNCHGKL